MGTFPHRKPPPRRHEERRAGFATAAFRDALDGARENDEVRLAPVELRRQRERREEHQRGRRRSDGRGAEFLLAVGLAVLVVAIIVATVAKLP